MASMTTTGAARTRLDRPVLVGNLASGVVCLALLALVSRYLLLIGAAYVVVGACSSRRPTGAGP